MKKFQYKNVKYEVPTSWQEIPLSMVMKMAEDEKAFKTDATRQLSYISAYAGIPVEILKKSTITEVQKLFKYLEFLQHPLPETPITDFEFQGNKYSLASTLLKQEFQDFVSMETVLADNDGDVYKALPMMLAIMCKREGESLDDYDLAERAEMFKDLPMTIAHPLSVFFWQQEKMSTILSQLSSQQESLIVMKANEVLITLNRRDGMGWLMRLLVSTLASWIRFTMLPRNKHSIFMRLKSSIMRCKQRCKKLFRRESIKKSCISKK